MATTLVGLPDDASGQPGQRVDVSLSIAPMNGIVAADIDIAYDGAVLNAVSVAATGLTQGFSLTYNVSTAGWIYVSLYAAQSTTGSGPALTVTFDTLAPGCSLLDISKALLNEGEIPATIDDGNFWVCDTADADGDGYSECGGDCSDRFSFVHPGGAERCNGADDDCDCAFDEGGVCACGTFPRPRTAGFWQRICHGTTLEGTIEPSYVDSVNDYTTFGGITTTNGICAVLTVLPPAAPCVAAEAHFMALLLDVTSGKLCLAQPISAASTVASTVGVAAAEVNALLVNPGRTSADCAEASAIATEINDGRAIADFLEEEIVLTEVRSAEGDIVFAWPEPDAPAAGRPIVYDVYRTPATVPFAWTLLGRTACHQRFTDRSAPGLPAGLYFYQVVGVNE